MSSAVQETRLLRRPLLGVCLMISRRNEMIIEHITVILIVPDSAAPEEDVGDGLAAVLKIH